MNLKQLPLIWGILSPDTILATSNQTIIENHMTNDRTFQTYEVQTSPVSTISTTDYSYVDMYPISSFPILHLATFQDPNLKIP